MRKINITELRNHLPEYLAIAQKGSEIWVTSHGKVIARILSPIDLKNEAIAKLKKLRKNCKVGDIISPIDEEWHSESEK